EEATRAGARYVGVNFVGSLHAGPTIMTEGSDEQKARYLPPVLRGDEVWCQGFSEPGAGSDLAALRTNAVRDGDHYVVNGQKSWCSLGHIADYGELLVRTDPDAPKHRGISWLILPMDTPGIDVRPIDTVIGSSEFCEVFLEDVRVPVANRVGTENDGWRITQVTFAFERGTAFASELVEARRMAEDLAGIARDPAHRHELGHVVAELDALWALTKRNVSRAARDGSPGDGALMVKLAYSESRQKLGDLSVRVLDRSALDIDNEFVVERLRTLALTIAAGTSQIQRHIISARPLGLPRGQPGASNLATARSRCATAFGASARGGSRSSACGPGSIGTRTPSWRAPVSSRCDLTASAWPTPPSCSRNWGARSCPDRSSGCTSRTAWSTGWPVASRWPTVGPRGWSSI